MSTEILKKKKRLKTPLKRKSLKKPSLRPPKLNPLCSFRLEKKFKLPAIAGVDEVGRGCIAGPVVAAAVMFSPDTWESCSDEELSWIQDSKKISEAVREHLDLYIRRKAVWVEVCEMGVECIDRINILQASLKAFGELVARAKQPLDLVLVDGNQRIPGIQCKQHCVIGGDSVSKSIAAASIVAKVYRDKMMKAFDSIYPAYRLAKNKGYGTKEHWLAIDEVGVTDIHRKSFLKRYEARKKGMRAENLVAEHFLKEGFRIVARNWASQVGELDLIVEKDSHLRFVEVRNNESFGAEAAFNSSKQLQFKKTVSSYLQQNRLESKNIHLDFVLVQNNSIKRFSDVFSG